MLSQYGASERLRRLCATGDRQAQKEAMVELFQDVGGLAPRLVRGMLATDDFYFDTLSQIRMPCWSHGRVAVVGDAAYAPSAVTGKGVLLAVLGAYLIAGELSLRPRDPPAAFRAYEHKFRPLVTGAQKLPLGGYLSDIASPQTSWGVWLVRWVFRLVAWSQIFTYMGTNMKGTEYDLSGYPKMNPV